MSNEVLMFGEIEIRKNKLYHHRLSFFWRCRY